MKKYLILALVALVLNFVLFFIFSGSKKQEFITQKVTRVDIEQSIEAIGEVYAKTQVDVGAQVSGQITKLYVKIGDRVKAGDLIAQIDKDKQQNDLDITKAQLASAKAKLESNKVSLDIALRQYQREQKLYAAKGTSLELLETAKSNFYTLKANVADLEAQVVQLEITLKNAEKDLGYTTITAPMDGIIINVAVDEGQTVNANQSTPTIVKIANLDEMEVKMQIAEADVSKLKVGEVVRFSILSDSRKQYEAKISSIDPANTEISDATSSSTSSKSSSSSSSSSSSNTAIYYYANFFVKNENNLLRIGMSTENQIIAASAKSAIAVPTYAIKNDDKGYFVDVLEAGKKVSKYVKLGLKDSLNTQILEGLNENEDLIVSSDTSNVSKPKLPPR